MIDQQITHEDILRTKTLHVTDERTQEQRLKDELYHLYATLGSIEYELADTEKQYRALVEARSAIYAEIATKNLAIRHEQQVIDGTGPRRFDLAPGEIDEMIRAREDEAASKPPEVDPNTVWGEALRDGLIDQDREEKIYNNARLLNDNDFKY